MFSHDAFLLAGFYVCKLKKMANGPKDSRGEGEDGEASESEEEGVPAGEEEEEAIDADEKPASSAAPAKGGRQAGAKRPAAEPAGAAPRLLLGSGILSCPLALEFLGCKLKCTEGLLRCGRSGAYAPDSVHCCAEDGAAAGPVPKKRRESRILKAAKRELELERAAAAQAAPGRKTGSDKAAPSKQKSGTAEQRNQSGASNGAAQQPKQALGKAGKKGITQKAEGVALLPAAGKVAVQKQSAGKQAGAVKKIKKQRAKG